MDKQITHYPACRSQDVFTREGHHYDTAYYRTTYEGGNKIQTIGTTYNKDAGNDQHAPNTHGRDSTKMCHGYKQSPNPDITAGVGTAYPWYFGLRETNVANSNPGRYMYNQTSADTNNYYRNHTGSSYQTIYDVKTSNERCNGSYPTLTSTAIKGTGRHVNVTWTNGTDSWKDGTAVYGYYDNTRMTDNINGWKDGKTPQGHGTLTSGHVNVPLNGLETRSNIQLYGARLQHQTSQSQSNAVSQAKEILDGASRKRKLPGEIETTSNNEVTNGPKVDKRALYSKFRVVKKTDRSPPCTGSSNVTPKLLRVKLDDKTIVDVNYEDGLPINAEKVKAAPTLTPVKVNEANATIGNIKFITLENMKIARRKLEVVLAIQQGEERQERLRLEAEVRAKMKVNAKKRTRKDKKCSDRKRQVNIEP